MSEAQQQTDVVIIGAGPVGLFAVFELGMLKLKAHVIDSLDMAGGQCAALYPEKPIFDIPAYPQILAGDLVERLVEQAAPFEPVYHLGQQATALARGEDGLWRVTTSGGATIAAHAVIIAAGAGAFGPNRPPLEGIQSFEEAGPGVGVHYMVRRREDFRDRTLVIAGGGDSALDWTVSLAEVAKKIYLVHRRPKFRGAPDTVAKMEALAAEGSVVEKVIPYQLSALEGSNGKLEAVAVRTLEGETRRLEADALLAFFGLSMNLGPIADWGLALDKSHVTVEPTTCETSVPGIFAIGDIVHYEHKLKLILTGFAEAAAAAHAIRPLARPGEELHWEYSTTKGVPDAA
ncbi:MAG: NAD(P)/FAD-dependent oxidoreductase [Pseudomonadota bacterium]